MRTKEEIDDLFENESEENALYDAFQSDFDELYLQYINLGEKLEELLFRYGSDVVECNKDYGLIMDLLLSTAPKGYEYWSYKMDGDNNEKYEKDLEKRSANV